MHIQTGGAHAVDGGFDLALDGATLRHFRHHKCCGPDGSALIRELCAGAALRA
jgi:hypothetical protein